MNHRKGEAVERADTKARAAYLLAARAFRGMRHVHAQQWRNFSGQNYGVHPARAEALQRAAGVVDTAVRVATLLHDGVEDQPARVVEAFGPRRAPADDARWFQDFVAQERDALDALREAFGPRVAELVAAVSKPRAWKGLPKEAVTQRMLAQVEAAEPAAWLIKVADRVDNVRDWPVERLPWGYLKEAVAISRAAERHVEEVPGLDVLLARLDGVVEAASEAKRRGYVGRTLVECEVALDAWPGPVEGGLALDLAFGPTQPRWRDAFGPLPSLYVWPKDAPTRPGGEAWVFVGVAERAW